MPTATWSQDLHFRAGDPGEKAAKVLTAFARAAGAKDAFALLQSLRLGSFQPAVRHYNAAVLAAYLAQDWEVALLLSQEAIQSVGCAGLDIRFWDRAISSCRESGQWQVASYFLACMRFGGIDADEICYANAMSPCLKGLEWQACISIYMQMCSDAVRPDLVCNGAVLTVCKTLHVWQQALGFYSDAFGVSGKPSQGSRLAPNEVCLNAALASLAISDRWQASAWLLIASRFESQRPDAVSFGAVMPAYERRRDWERASSLLAAAPRAGVSAFNAATSVCEKAGAWELALDIGSAWMPTRRLNPDLISLNAAASACEKVSVWTLAMDLLTSLPNRSLRPDAFSHAACTSACGNAAEWQFALELRSGACLVGASAALTACEQGRRWRPALQLLGEIGLLTALDTVAWNSVIAACTRCYEWEQALSLSAAMRHAVVLPNILTYEFILEACELASHAAGAPELLESAPVWLLS